jgi:hypothetical protein
MEALKTVENDYFRIAVTFFATSTETDRRRTSLGN